jgi:flavin reductase (DIM6/NTAB) family NADH-FMN oxidoreductase RutF
MVERRFQFALGIVRDCKACEWRNASAPALGEFGFCLFPFAYCLNPFFVTRSGPIMDVAEIETVYALLDSPLWLVTAADADRRGGLIATTVAQASIVSEIPRQLIAISKRHHTHGLIEGCGAFALHLIDETQLDLVWRFGLRSGRDIDKFAGLPFRTGATGSPLLPEALAWFDCRVEARMDSGDRTVYLAAVVDGRLERTDPPLTSRRFFEIAPPDKQKIMDEQYEQDALVDAESIKRWRA